MRTTGGLFLCVLKSKRARYKVHLTHDLDIVVANDVLDFFDISPLQGSTFLLLIGRVSPDPMYVLTLQANPDLNQFD